MFLSDHCYYTTFHKERFCLKLIRSFTKGLLVVLDAHSDLLSPGSVNADFQGLTAMIDSGGSFPMTTYKGFHLKPGHMNLVTLSATKISATLSLKAISPLKRNCYFSEENQGLIMHKEYTQSNCQLECTLTLAQESLKLKLNRTKPCTPWYLPFGENTTTLCDPWEAKLFNDFVFSGSVKESCAHCLADCSKTIYQPIVTAAPFRTCDDTNFGTSHFCTLDDPSLPQPRIWGKQIKDEYNVSSTPDYIKNIISSERFMIRNPSGFSQLKSNYDSYEKDIATLQVYFNNPAVFLFESDQRQTWVGFLSTIGGLLGLCIGLSLVTFIEVFWLSITLAANVVNPKSRKS